MSQALAQITLTLVFLAGAVVFVLLEQQELAVALVGAIAGQGATISTQAVVNGKKEKP